MIMIRRPAAATQDRSPPAIAAPVPGWLRGGVAEPASPAAQGVSAGAPEDVALLVGAALGALDALVRRDEPWAGAWRQRLALTAAASTARQAGRAEDEAALRDAVLLTRAGDDPGPGGAFVLAWRRLTGRQVAAFVGEDNLAAMLEEFGCAPEPETAADLADGFGRLGQSDSAVELLTGAFTLADHARLPRFVGAWLADALLARRLGWAHALPLLGTEIAAGAGRRRRGSAVEEASPDETPAERTRTLLAAQARAALRAIDLSTELGRRATRLVSVAPKLRAKGAEEIVERLLNEDALVASRGAPTNGMSDRALRRLFDRLVDLGAVRELTGRPTFRIYGL